MSAITIRLSPPLEDWVRRKVEGGQFEDAADYVRALIRRDQEASHQEALSVADIRSSIESGRVQAMKRPASVIFDELDARLRSMAK